MTRRSAFVAALLAPFAVVEIVKRNAERGAEIRRIIRAMNELAHQARLCAAHLSRALDAMRRLGFAADGKFGPSVRVKALKDLVAINERIANLRGERA